MSDINTYADETAIAGLSPINGDLVLNKADSSLYLCTNADATGIARWKKFANDSAAVPFQNRWGASFDGSNDYLSCGTLSALNSAADFSVSMWVNFQSFVANSFGYNILLGAGTGSSNRFIVNAVRNTATSANKLEVYFCDASGPSIVNTSLSLTTNTWYHIAVYKSGADMSFYIDNILKGSRSDAPTSASTTGNSFSIGRGIYGGQYSSNILADEVAVWDTALSAADRSKIYNGTAPNGKPTDLTLAASYDTDRTSNLVGYWRMGDDSNDSPSSDPASNKIVTITDSSGNGNDATQSTASNQPTFSALASSETIYS